MEELGKEDSEKSKQVNRVKQNTLVPYWIIAFGVIGTSIYVVSRIHDNASYNGLDGLDETFIAVPFIDFLIALLVIYGTVLITNRKQNNVDSSINTDDESKMHRIENKLRNLSDIRLGLLVYVIVPATIIGLWWISASA